MLKVMAITGLAMLWSVVALAGGSEYQLRVDGLACPYCAYGIEKSLKKIEGVETVDVNLGAGLVVVNVAAGVELTESQMKALFTDAGFTYRSMTMTPLEKADSD